MGARSIMNVKKIEERTEVMCHVACPDLLRP
jgi:hypothetical protein